MADSDDDVLGVAPTTATEQEDIAQTATVEAHNDEPEPDEGAPESSSSSASSEPPQEDEAVEHNEPVVEEPTAEGEDESPKPMSKKEAKRLLSSKEYKKWKKAQKKAKAKKDKKDSSGKKEKKEKKGKKKEKKEKKKDKNEAKSEKSKSKTGKKRGRIADAEDADIQENIDFDNLPDVQAPAPRNATKQKQKQKKLTANQTKMLVETKAKELVEKMAEAQRLDIATLRGERAGVPIHRVEIRDYVMSIARRYDFHEALVGAGFLKHLGHWIADKAAKDLAPYDLRTAAYEILLMMQYEGVNGTGRGDHKKKKKRKGGFGEEIEDDDLDAYPGVRPEDLKPTILGWAVNFARKHKEETVENQARATRLLELFSRCFHGGDEDHDEERGRQQQPKLWSSMGDPTVAPPFVPLVSSSEKFQAKAAKVDPLDPTSYFRVPPLQVPNSYIAAIYVDEFK